MRLLSACLLMAAAAGACRGADDPGTLLSAELGTGEWKPLIDQLAGKGTIQAAFTERRYFPFRREGTLLKGTIRISPERGISLQYTDPDPSVLVADESGILIKEDDGSRREVPGGSREGGAVASLLPIMRFDLAALYPRFEIRAFHLAGGWRFELKPKDPDAAGALGDITVEGVGTDVTRLEFRRSASQRVEIQVGRTTSGAPFSPADLKEFFR